MRLVVKSLISALHNRSLSRPVVFLRQSSETLRGTLKRVYSQSKGGKTGKNKGNKSQIPIEAIIIGSTFVGFMGYQFYQYYDTFFDEGETIVLNELQQVSNVSENEVGKFKAGLPAYQLSEIIKHNNLSSRMWVTYKEGVYDVTEFVKIHPGGPQILKAAGSSLEPFFHIYAVHQSDHVYTVLETYRIGNLQKDDTSARADDKDPFSKDPIRHGALIPIVKKPFNGGPDPAVLVQSFFTPGELYYVRNHMYVPDLDPATYKVELSVEGVSKTYTFTLDDIKKMPQVTIIATLMCIGNRRTEMLKVKPMTAVVAWNNSAIGCAKWTGVRLRDFLKIAGIDGEDERYKHVHFEGYDHDNTGTHFASSMPIWRAVDKRTDVLLAYEMNGSPLPRDHGYPLRLIIPGCAGVRQVKWLSKVYVAEKESEAHWYKNEYKAFSPNTDWNNVDFSSSPPAFETPVTSSICSPVDGDTVEVTDGYVTFTGYAWSGNGCRITRVDVTPDGGKTWLDASLEQLDTSPPQHWTWTLFTIDIPVSSSMSEVEVWAKAVDSSFNSQPESFENIYNFRGVFNNAYPRVKVKLKH